jgi:hypothetical protein
VHQPWDKLRTCVVGKTYAPEFYSFIENPKIRNLFERIAIETTEDYDFLAKTLQNLDVEVVRPNIPNVDVLEHIKKGERIPRPISMIPRDQAIMIGYQFFMFPYDKISNKHYMENPVPLKEQKELAVRAKNLTEWWSPILEKVLEAGNNIIEKKWDSLLEFVGANGITRCGRDLYFGVDLDPILQLAIKKLQKKYFSNYRCHEVPSEGHMDGVFCPVVPGLILSVDDGTSYTESFPDWEVMYLPNEAWHKVKPFLELKDKNGGRWWIKGYENDSEVFDFVETWLRDWTGYMEESVFDVNILTVNRNNVIVNNYNKEVFAKFEQYGITPHICPLRHRYFWDGGIHCSTLDLDREGELMDYFPERGDSLTFIIFGQILKKVLLLKSLLKK